MIRRLLLALAFVAGWSAGASADGHRCAGLAAVYINAFSAAPMEILDAEDTIVNPCTGTREIAAMEFKPGYGFVATFPSGDEHGEVDSYIATLCKDGRAMLRNLETRALICDTR